MDVVIPIVIYLIIGGLWRYVGSFIYHWIENEHWKLRRFPGIESRVDAALADLLNDDEVVKVLWIIAWPGMIIVGGVILVARMLP